MVSVVGRRLREVELRLERSSLLPFAGEWPHVSGPPARRISRSSHGIDWQALPPLPPSR